MYEEAAMERQRLAVTKRVGLWGAVYIIGGTEADGETLPAEQADDLIARFEHEQALFFPPPSLQLLPLMQCDVDN